MSESPRRHIMNELKGTEAKRLSGIQIKAE
jgi:hypothetical protein